jgi:hypothetical protein
MGTGGPFPGGKARRERDADHSPPSSVENEYELYFFSLQAPSWRVVGQLYIYRWNCFVRDAVIESHSGKKLNQNGVVCCLVQVKFVTLISVSTFKGCSVIFYVRNIKCS